MERIKRLNDEMAVREKSKLNPTTIRKCTESGLWLFAWSAQLSAKDLV